MGQVLTQFRGYRRFSFADNVRKAVYTLNPYIKVMTDDDRETYWPVQELVDRYGWEFVKVQYADARRYLQVMGTEVGREMFGGDSWIEMCGRQINELPFDIPVVITDVRYKNEANYVRKLGGVVVRVFRPGTGPVNDHASDKIDFEADFIIHNEGTPGELVDKVLALDSTWWSS